MASRIHVCRGMRVILSSSARVRRSAGGVGMRSATATFSGVAGRAAALIN